jgi:hypothetical protein
MDTTRQAQGALPDAFLLINKFYKLFLLTSTRLQLVECDYDENLDSDVYRPVA